MSEADDLPTAEDPRAAREELAPQLVAGALAAIECQPREKRLEACRAAGDQVTGEAFKQMLRHRILAAAGGARPGEEAFLATIVEAALECVVVALRNREQDLQLLAEIEARRG